MNCLETLQGGLLTMDFNTILMRFGLNPDDFENRYPYSNQLMDITILRCSENGLCLYAHIRLLGIKKEGLLPPLQTAPLKLTVLGIDPTKSQLI